MSVNILTNRRNTLVHNVHTNIVSSLTERLRIHANVSHTSRHRVNRRTSSSWSASPELVMLLLLSLWMMMITGGIQEVMAAASLPLSPSNKMPETSIKLQSNSNTTTMEYKSNSNHHLHSSHTSHQSNNHNNHHQTKQQRNNNNNIKFNATAPSLAEKHTFATASTSASTSSARTSINQLRFLDEPPYTSIDTFVDQCVTFIFTNETILGVNDTKISQDDVAIFINHLCVSIGICDASDPPIIFEGLPFMMQMKFVWAVCPNDLPGGPEDCYADLEEQGDEYGFIITDEVEDQVRANVTAFCRDIYADTGDYHGGTNHPSDIPSSTPSFKPSSIPSSIPSISRAPISTPSRGVPPPSPAPFVVVPVPTAPSPSSENIGQIVAFVSGGAVVTFLLAFFVVRRSRRRGGSASDSSVNGSPFKQPDDDIASYDEEVGGGGGSSRKGSGYNTPPPLEPYSLNSIDEEADINSSNNKKESIIAQFDPYSPSGAIQQRFDRVENNTGSLGPISASGSMSLSSADEDSTFGSLSSPPQISPLASSSTQQQQQPSSSSFIPPLNYDYNLGSNGSQHENDDGEDDDDDDHNDLMRELDAAMDAGDWAAVAALAGDISAAEEDEDSSAFSSAKSFHTSASGGTARSRGHSVGSGSRRHLDEKNLKRATRIDELIAEGDWVAVGATAALFDSSGGGSSLSSDDDSDSSNNADIETGGWNPVGSTAIALKKNSGSRSTTSSISSPNLSQDGDDFEIEDDEEIDDNGLVDGGIIIDTVGGGVIGGTFAANNLSSSSSSEDDSLSNNEDKNAQKPILSTFYKNNKSMTSSSSVTPPASDKEDSKEEEKEKGDGEGDGDGPDGKSGKSPWFRRMMKRKNSSGNSTRNNDSKSLKTDNVAASNGAGGDAALYGIAGVGTGSNLNESTLQSDSSAASSWSHSSNEPDYRQTAVMGINPYGKRSDDSDDGYGQKKAAVPPELDGFGDTAMSYGLVAAELEMDMEAADIPTDNSEGGSASSSTASSNEGIYDSGFGTGSSSDDVNSRDSLRQELDIAIENGDWTAVEQQANRMLDNVVNDDGDRSSNNSRRTAGQSVGGNAGLFDTSSSSIGNDLDYYDESSRGWTTGDDKSMVSAASSAIDDERIATLERLIDADDWQGIVTVSRIHNREDSTTASSVNDPQMSVTTSSTGDFRDAQEDANAADALWSSTSPRANAPAPIPEKDDEETSC